MGLFCKDWTHLLCHSSLLHRICSTMYSGGRRFASSVYSSVTLVIKVSVNIESPSFPMLIESFRCKKVQILNVVFNIDQKIFWLSSDQTNLDKMIFLKFSCINICFFFIISFLIVRPNS